MRLGDPNTGKWNAAWLNIHVGDRKMNHSPAEADGVCDHLSAIKLGFKLNLHAAKASGVFDF